MKSKNPDHCGDPTCHLDSCDGCDGMPTPADMERVGFTKLAAEEAKVGTGALAWSESPSEEIVRLRAQLAAAERQINRLLAGEEIESDRIPVGELSPAEISGYNALGGSRDSRDSSNY